MKKINITLLKQIGINNCWAASLSMALQVFNIFKTESELDAMFGAYDQGINLDQINEQFPELFPDLSTVYKSEIFTGQNPILTFQEIINEIDKDNPILIGVNDFNGHLAHALLIFGYNETGQLVFIADPWTGKEVEYRYADVLKFIWTETLIIMI
jgi:ABC-type bacteriocin/lantibiotic exporter with double-glycine peptidase domain